MLPSIFVICFRLPMDSTSRWPYWPHNLSMEGMSSRLSYQRTCDTSVMSVIKQMTFLVIVYFSYCISASSIVENPSNDLVYNNQFAVNIPNASEVLVQFIAEKHGFRSLGQVTKLNTPNIEIVLEFPSLVYKWGKSCIYRLELSLNVFLFFFTYKDFHLKYSSLERRKSIHCHFLFQPNTLLIWTTSFFLLLSCKPDLLLGGPWKPFFFVCVKLSSLALDYLNT